MRIAPLLVLLSACGGAQTPNANSGAACLLSAADATGLFAAVGADVSEVVASAASAGEIVAAAEKSADTFDEKMVQIAADPALSAQWEKVAQEPSKARKAGLAADLPTNASALRAAGVPEAEVKTAVEGASKAKMGAEEISDAFAATAGLIATWGTIDGFGSWFVTRVEAGDRGTTLLDGLETEYQSRGTKVGDTKAEICHRPPGNPDNAKTLSVGASAVSAHLGHGDSEGPCDGEGKSKGKVGGKGDGPAKGLGGGGGHGKGEGKGEGKGKGKGKGK